METLADISAFETLQNSTTPTVQEVTVFNDISYIEFTLLNLKNNLDFMFPTDIEKQRDELLYSRAQIDAAAFLSEVIDAELKNKTATVEEVKKLLSMYKKDIQDYIGVTESDIMSGDYLNRRTNVLG